MIGRIRLRAVPSTLILAVGVVIACLLLELTLFNYRSLIQPPEGDARTVIAADRFILSGFSRAADDSELLVADAQSEHAIELDGLDQVIRTLHIPLSSNKRQVITCHIYQNDAASSACYLIADQHQLSGKIAASQYVLLNPDGKSSKIRIVFDLLADESFRLEQIELNQPIPLSFSLIRCLGLALLSLTALFLRRSWLCRQTRQPGDPHQATCQFVLVLLVVFFGLVLAILTQGDRLVDFKGYGSDLYSRDLIDALAKGQLHLLTEPPQALSGLTNPYDPVQRAQAGINGLIWDAAYFNGRYYVYFGIVPAVLLLLPFHLLTGLYLSSAWVVILSAVGSFIVLQRLLDQLLLQFFARLPFRFHLLAGMALAAGSNLWWCLARPKFYEAVITAGLLLGVSGLYLLFGVWQRHLAGRRAPGRLLAGCLLLALAIGTRPNLLLLSLLPLPLFFTLIRTPAGSALPSGVRRRAPLKDRVMTVLAIAAPYLVVGLALMAYNRARFGSVLEFGARYQLTVTDMASRGMMAPTRIIPGLWYYLFQAPIANTRFPFLHFQTIRPFSYSGYFYTDQHIAGLLVTLPICWLLAAWPWTARSLSSRRRLTGRLVTGLVLTGLLLACVNSMAAGSTGRYLTDFAWLFVLSAILIGAHLTDQSEEGFALADGQADAQPAVLSVCGLLAGLTVATAVLLSLQGENNLIQLRGPVLYLRLERLLAFWLP